jgi:hypothetical protein
LPWSAAAPERLIRINNVRFLHANWLYQIEICAATG